MYSEYIYFGHISYQERTDGEEDTYVDFTNALAAYGLGKTLADELFCKAVLAYSLEIAYGQNHLPGLETIKKVYNWEWPIAP